MRVPLRDLNLLSGSGIRVQGFGFTGFGVSYCLNGSFIGFPIILEGFFKGSDLNLLSGLGFRVL